MTLEQVKFIVETVYKDSMDKWTLIENCAWLTLTKMERELLYLNNKLIKFNSAMETIEVIPVQEIPYDKTLKSDSTIKTILRKDGSYSMYQCAYYVPLHAPKTKVLLADIYSMKEIITFAGLEALKGWNY